MKTLPLYLDGQWENSEVSLPVYNPADDQRIAEVSVVDRARAKKQLNHPIRLLMHGKTFREFSGEDICVPLPMDSDVRRRRSQKQ